MTPIPPLNFKLVASAAAGGESVSAGGRDPHLADIDQPAAGPDLLARQGRKSTVDQPVNHADAKSVYHERRLRGPIEARAREHSQRAALLGRQAHFGVPDKLSLRSIQFGIAVVPRLPHRRTASAGRKDETGT